MKLPLFQVDAFASKPFEGNPAAVVPLESWLPDNLMQNIAMENNLAETAFFVREGDGFRLRWFTPAIEVDLCGHATLASAHVLFNHLSYDRESITFQTRSGLLPVVRSGEGFAMDFPADRLIKAPVPVLITEGLGIEPVEVFQGREDYLAILETEDQIRALQPDFRTILKLGGRGLIASAPGKTCDFVSRCFFPQAGIDEDPVTGSAHTTLTPYWAARLAKNHLSARQLSRREGAVDCTLEGERVILKGQAITVLEGYFLL